MDDTTQSNTLTALINGFREVNIGATQLKGLLALYDEALLMIISEVTRLEPDDGSQLYIGSPYARKFKHLRRLALTSSRLYHLALPNFYKAEVFEMAFTHCHVSIVDRFVEFRGLPAWFVKPCLCDRLAKTWALLETTLGNFTCGNANLRACFDTMKWYRDFRRRPPTHRPCTNCSIAIRGPSFHAHRYLWIDDEGNRLARLLEGLVVVLDLPGEDLLYRQMRMAGMVSMLFKVGDAGGRV